MTLETQVWLTLEEVMEILEPHHADLRGCVDAGWTKWLTKVKPLFPRPKPRFRANTVWQGMIDEARLRFSDVPGVEIFEPRSDRFFLIVDRRLLLRFKMLDEKRRTSNVRTPASQKLDAQMDLPAVPDGSMITIGYRVDAVKMELKDVLVVMSRSNKVAWFYDIERPDATGIVRITPQPTQDNLLDSTNRFRQPEIKEGDNDDDAS